jgi:uncharacterized protein YxeA
MLKKIILLLIIIIGIILSYIVFIKKEKFNDGKYLVQISEDNNTAVDLLATLYNNIRLTVYYANEKINKIKNKGNLTDTDKDILKFEPYLKTILDKIDYVTIRESVPKSKYTSYSVNKGEELVFCIRSKETNRLHDINDLMYVALHEFAHIGCPELDHTPLFYKINRFLLEMATEINVYKYTNYGSTPLNYCGLMLTSNVLDIN